MKVNISGILKNIDSSIKINDSLSIPLISYKGEDIIVKSPIGVDARIMNSGDYMLIKGNIKADFVLKCSRCLEKFDYVLETDFEEKISNKHVDENDEEIIYFEGDSIDITDIIINNILLSLPMKHVCREDCKGLCPHCGKNVNMHDCDCFQEDLDPRLEVLKNLLKDN
jgi:uncharacterized protein